MAVALWGLALPGLGSQPAGADVTQLKGAATGAFVKVGLFGGEPNQVGPAPTVTLPPGGGDQAKSLPQLIAQFGPATIFGGQYKDPGRNPSGELKVSTRGKTGPGGSVTSETSVVNVGPGPLIADKLSSTCTANEAGVTASTTVTKGILETSYNKETQEAATTETIPERPPPNLAFNGTIDHVGDHFRVVYNEQIVEGRTITVRAAHMYLLGNIAVGDLIVGESICGITAAAGAPAATTTVPATTAAVPETTAPSTTAAPTTTLPDPDTDLASSNSDAGGVPVVPVLGVVGLLVLGGLMVFRRRRRPRM